MKLLRANVVWSLGLDKPKVFTVFITDLIILGHVSLSSQEVDVKAEKGAYFVSTEIELFADSSKEWMLVANVNQNHSDIASIVKTNKRR